VEPLEQPIEGIPPDLVGDVSLEPVLQRVRLEQASIKKWHSPEASRGLAALAGRPVQRPEKQRTEQIAIDSSLATEASVYFFGQEPLTAGKPSFGLHEVEEEDPGELEESEVMAFVPPHRSREAGGQPLESGSKLAKEATPGALTGERIRCTGCIGQSATHRGIRQPRKTAQHQAVRGGQVDYQLLDSIEGDPHAETAELPIESEDAGNTSAPGEPARQRSGPPLRLRASDAVPRKRSDPTDHDCPVRQRLELRHLLPQRLVPQSGQKLGHILRPLEAAKQRLEIQTGHSSGRESPR
jgi:hypothetical protein